MKRIDKRFSIFLTGCLLVCMLTGCSKEVVLPYSAMTDNSSFKLLTDSADKTNAFAAEFCVGDSNVLLEGYAIEQVGAAGLFDLNSSEVVYASNMHDKLYPASLTKLLTALVAIKYGSLDQVLTATNAVNITEPGAVICGIRAGDSMTLEQALHLLLIRSGNDVANLIAENIAGSVEDFIALMNEEAAKLGATNSHFMNAHGLHHTDHYTTIYDIYLIFKEAVKYEAITQIIGQSSYSTTYKDKYGSNKNISVSTTNAYFKQLYAAPQNVTILGGKTGTTNEAGNCLGLYVKDISGDPYIAVILHGNTRDDLYIQMKQLLEQVHR
ncbi:MAG: D-alanyl-D-alanine carboxypeptidase [Lachnospiraceae bacterium]|nr:D-alanyl-D-alanine carboxypeptidase [Lachnospiraceae bacterium]